MKSITKLSLLTLIFLAFSCSTDTVVEPEDNLEILNAKSATRAWKGKFSNVADLTMPLVGCIPEDAGVALTTNIISGNMTHMGKIQPGSFGRPQDGTCFLTGVNSLNVIYHVNYIGAHGDMITTVEPVTIILDLEADPTGLTGIFENTRDASGNMIPITILEGTGRFEGATGELYFKNAKFSPAPNGTVVSTWQLVGEITY